jgi:hypothetical protein
MVVPSYWRAVATFATVGRGSDARSDDGAGADWLVKRPGGCGVLHAVIPDRMIPTNATKRHFTELIVRSPDTTYGLLCQVYHMIYIFMIDDIRRDAIPKKMVIATLQGFLFIR